jgi:hypothetical protein
MSTINNNKPFKFSKTIVVKGSKKTSTDPNKKMTDEEAIEEVVREFSVGTVINASLIEGRGGNAVQFEAVGGILPNGDEYNDIVNYSMPVDAQHNPIEQNIPMPKIAEVIESVEKEDESFEESALTPLVMTAIISSLVVLGYVAYKHLTKTK